MKIPEHKKPAFKRKAKIVLTFDDLESANKWFGKKHMALLHSGCCGMELMNPRKRKKV